MKHIIIVFLVIGILVLGLISIAWWPPDMWSDKVVVVARLKVRDGEFIEFTQRWAGDGYATAVQHFLPSGLKLRAVGDGDAAKAWSARMEHDTNNATVIIRFNKEDWLYHYDSKSLVIKGQRSRFCDVSYMIVKDIVILEEACSLAGIFAVVFGLAAIIFGGLAFMTLLRVAEGRERRNRNLETMMILMTWSKKLRAFMWRGVVSLACLCLAWAFFQNSFVWFRAIGVEDENVQLYYCWSQRTQLKRADIREISVERNRNERFYLHFTTRTGASFRSIPTDQEHLVKEVERALRKGK